MINWEVRIANKQFWISIIPAMLLLIQAVANLFGFVLDLGEIGNKLLLVVDAVFSVLVILGVVVDPTTEGVGDSVRALGYIKPSK